MANAVPEDLKRMLAMCFAFLSEYQFFTESYIIEFFTESHWKKLPLKWKAVLNDIQPFDVADKLLNPNSPEQGYQEVWPLSLLAFKKCSHVFSLCRQKTTVGDDFKHERSQTKDLSHIFRRHVNPKKQHEILVLSKVIERVYSTADCTSIIDVGSGQGHLSRLLSLAYNLPVISIEHEERHLEMARKFDKEALLFYNKRKEEKEIIQVTPTHLQYTVRPEKNHSELIRHIQNNIDERSRPKLDRCLLTGLHACGDLSSEMLRLFAKYRNMKALVSVACCYMKLTTDCDEYLAENDFGSTDFNYPMSCTVRKLKNHQLPYKSREIACHAIEDYALRLKENGQHLKMHCYRAVLEYFIRKLHPDLVRPGVQTIKKAYLLPFSEYFKKAFEKLNLPHDYDEQILSEATEMLCEWKKVVAFFTLALMTAPVVETVILLDRLLYLSEKGLRCELVPVFDPVVSPRCFAIIASKK